MDIDLEKEASIGYAIARTGSVHLSSQKHTATIAYDAIRVSSVQGVEPKHVLPLEGSHFSSGMRHLALIILEPDEVNPRNV